MKYIKIILFYLLSFSVVGQGIGPMPMLGMWQKGWSQVGNDLNIADVNRSALAALSSTRVAFIDNFNDDLRVYDFDGTDWSQVGNELAVSGVGGPALAPLSSTRVAFIDGFNDDLRVYDFYQ